MRILALAALMFSGCAFRPNVQTWRWTDSGWEVHGIYTWDGTEMRSDGLGATIYPELGSGARQEASAVLGHPGGLE